MSQGSIKRVKLGHGLVTKAPPESIYDSARGQKWTMKIVKETEKAILLQGSITLGGKVIIGERWLPKSQIKITNEVVEVPEWLLKTDIDDGFSYTVKFQEWTET